MNNFYYTNNELYHYGVLGMKWGVRHNNPVTPGQYKKKLNSNDIHSSKHVGEYIRNDYKARKQTGKIKTYANKLKSKGKLTDTPDRKASKMINKLAKYETAKTQHKQAYKAIDAETINLINKAVKSGYVVNSKQTLRYNNTGKVYVASALGGVIGATAYTVASSAYNSKIANTSRYATKLNNISYKQSPAYVVGNQYKVSSY